MSNTLDEDIDAFNFLFREKQEPVLNNKILENNTNTTEHIICTIKNKTHDDEVSGFNFLFKTP